MNSSPKYSLTTIYIAGINLSGLMHLKTHNFIKGLVYFVFNSPGSGSA